jgi:hypothetical protein
VIFSAFTEYLGFQVQQKFYEPQSDFRSNGAHKTFVVVDNQDILGKRQISHFVQLIFLYNTRCKQLLSFLFLESEETHKTTNSLRNHEKVDRYVDKPLRCFLILSFEHVFINSSCKNKYTLFYKIRSFYLLKGFIID